MAAARCMAAVVCAAAVACAAAMACRRATDAVACHSRHLKPVGFRGWRLARMAAVGAMMVVARVPFYRGLETSYGLATPFGGLIASSCGWVTLVRSGNPPLRFVNPAVVWGPSTVV